MNAQIESGDPVPQTAKWAVALEHIAKLSVLEADWDGEGACKISQALIESAYQLAIRLRSEGERPPQDVYPLNEGTIILEWQDVAKKIITRIEVETPGHGEVMISYPDRETEFFPIDCSNGVLS